MTKTDFYLNNIVQAAGIVLLGLVFSKLISYLYVILLARLGSSIYGLLTLGFTILSFLSVLALIGLKSAVLRYVAFYKGKKDKKRIKGIIISSLSISLPISILASIFIIIFSEKISLGIFHNPGLIPVLNILAAILPIKSVSKILLTTIQAFQQIKYVTLIEQIIENVVKLALTFVLVLFGFKLFGPLVAFVIASIITLILSFHILNKKIFSITNKNVKTIYNKKELILFSLPLLLSDFFVNFIKWIDTWLIGYFRTTSEVGLYNTALPTANLLVIIPTALMAIFVPVITELYARNKISEVNKISKFISKWIFFINIPIAAFLILFSKNILSIMFGKEYEIAYVAMIILVLSNIPYSLSHVHANILQMIKKTKTIFFIFLIVTLINIILNLILIPKYGMVGAAIAAASYFLLLYILMSIYSFKFKKIQILRLIYIKSIISIIITILLIIQFTNLVKPNSIINLLIISLILFIVYIILLMLLGGLEKEDINLFYNLKNKFLNKNN